MRWIILCLECCCMLALVDGQLKPVVESEEHNHVLLSLIAGVDRFRPVKNFVTFFGNEDLGHGNSITTSLQKHIMDTFGRPVIVAGPHIRSLKRIINDRNLAVVLFYGMNDPVLTAVHESLNEIKTIHIIFVYKSKNPLPLSTVDLKKFFKWCNEKQFYSVLLLTKKNNKYEFYSYVNKSKMRIIKLNEKAYLSIAETNFRKFGDMGQSKSLVAVYQSLTDAFVMNSSESDRGNITLSGRTGLLLNEFMSYVNGSMDIVKMPYEVYTKEIAQGCNGNRCIDIGANLISNDSLSKYSPRLMLTRACLVIPYERRIPFEEFSSPFSKDCSILALSAFIFVANTIIKRIANPHQSMYNILYSSLRLVLGQTIAFNVFRRLGLSERFIEISTLVYNLMFVSIILGSVSMALTAGLVKQQIVDVETFLDSGLRIMVSPDQMPDLFDHIPSELSHRVLLVDKDTRDHHIVSLNDSYAYVLLTHKWPVFDYIQQRLRKPKMRLAPDKLCGVNMNLRFHVRSGLPFINVLERFVNQARETGLVKKWMQSGLIQAQQTKKLAQAPYDPPIQQKLPLAFFRTPFMVFAMGILASLLAFCMEIAYTRYVRNNPVII